MKIELNFCKRSERGRGNLKIPPFIVARKKEEEEEVKEGKGYTNGQATMRQHKCMTPLRSQKVLITCEHY
jgi:hypothetical protein